jgi:GNAT superfamily N-acetyltransferase
MTQIRRAGPRDARTIAAMRYAFRTELAAPAEPEQQFLDRATAWFEDRLGNAGRTGCTGWTCWLARQQEQEQQEQPVGLVLVQLIEKVPNPVVEPEALGYVSSLYVRPQWRGRGIGDRLLGTAVGFCRDNGVEAVLLWPSPRSVPLYERQGFRRQAKVMELRVAVESSPELRRAAEHPSLPVPRLSL